MYAGDLMEVIDEQNLYEQRRQDAELTIRSARIAAGEDPREVLQPMLTEDDEEFDDTPAADTGEEVYDLTDSDWRMPQEGDVDALDQILASMPEHATVSSADLPGPDVNAPTMPDNGGDREWL